MPLDRDAEMGREEECTHGTEEPVTRPVEFGVGRCGATAGVGQKGKGAN